MKNKLYTLVYNWPTESERGFNHMEQAAIIAKIGKENMNMEKYDNAMTGITCITGLHGIITYHCDILTGLICALEDRDPTFLEWD